MRARCVATSDHVFEEAQLYAPITTTEDGTVTVHLDEDHPGFGDPVYRERRNRIAARALHWDARRPGRARRLHRGGTGRMVRGLP